jgi:hypothetical protein
MKSAASHLIEPTSFMLFSSFRFCEYRSDLSCHHIRCLRNLSTFTLRQTLIFDSARAIYAGFTLI